MSWVGFTDNHNSWIQNEHFQDQKMVSDYWKGRSKEEQRAYQLRRPLPGRKGDVDLKLNKKPTRGKGKGKDARKGKGKGKGRGHKSDASPGEGSGVVYGRQFLTTASARAKRGGVSKVT